MTKHVVPGCSPDADDDQDCQAAVSIDLQNALYQNLPVSQLSAMGVVVVFVVFFRGHVDGLVLISWFVYMCMVAGIRLFMGRRYRQASSPRNINYWDKAFYAGVVLASLGWAAAGLAFFDETHLTQQILLVGSVAGVSAGSIVHLSPSLRAANTFLLLCLTPVIYAFLTSPAVGRGLGLLILLFMFMMLFVIKRTHVFLRNNSQLLHGNRRLVAELTSRTHALESAKAQDEAEREMALSVFQAILPHSALASDNVSYHLSSHSAFNGDMLLIETRPDGRQNVMLGDFTGHGLAASLGAIPAADIFVSMTRKGFPLNAIASEINRKLHTHLPRNLFCAACLVEIDPGHGRVKVWNGGLPSVYLLRDGDGKTIQQISAAHPPLGILSPGAFVDATQTYTIDEGDQVFMATDGVIEQRNAAGEMFGEQRLEEILNTGCGIRALSRGLKDALTHFGKGVDQGDDMTFVAVRAECDHRPVAPMTGEAGDESASLLQEPNWSLQLVLHPEAMKRIDPVPVLNHLIRELNDGSEALVPLELVLGELYKNALDHGVLGLSSTQKQSVEGFDAYYRLRDQQLAALRDGSVTLHLTNHPMPDGGMLELQVSDTGTGFDYERVEGDVGTNMAAHGRGLPLVRAFCRSLEYQGCGNQVRAVFRWNVPDVQ